MTKDEFDKDVQRDISRRIKDADEALAAEDAAKRLAKHKAKVAKTNSLNRSSMNTLLTPKEAGTRVAESIIATIQEKHLTPAEKRKREEVAQAIHREHPDMPMGKKMAIATQTAKNVAEGWSDEDTEARQRMFAGPDTALRRPTKSNPRIHPCPSCKAPNRLTPKDKQLGYQCDDCARRDEGGGFFP